MNFRIEHIFGQTRPAYLLARQIGAGDFQVTATSTLGGVAIKPYLQIPRVLTTEGTPDLTIFAFVLASANDLPKLSIGQVVALENR
jgi:hypothetical protein